MFYFKNWENFCEDLSKSNIIKARAKDILNGGRFNQFIILKHDVETNPIIALKLAEIEYKYKIRGTYYIQAYLLDNPANIPILQKIKALGHEVSYHYDVLDANKGNFEKAKQDFKYNVDRFNTLGFTIETVCQHGNPVMNRVGYSSNRDFFRNESITAQYSKIADVVVNFKEKTGTNYIYISDAGYSWKLISDPENNDKGNTVPDIPLNGFKGILEMINDGNSIILSTHPHRWKKNIFLIYFRIIIFKFIKSNVRFLSKIRILNLILSRFYFLAKKI